MCGLLDQLSQGILPQVPSDQCPKEIVLVLGSAHLQGKKWGMSLGNGENGRYPPDLGLGLVSISNLKEEEEEELQALLCSQTANRYIRTRKTNGN